MKFVVKDVYDLLNLYTKAPLPPASCIEVLKDSDAVHISNVLKGYMIARPRALNPLIKKIIDAKRLPFFVSLSLTDEEFKEVVYNSVSLAGYMKKRFTTEPVKGKDDNRELYSFAVLMEKVFTPPGEDWRWVWDDENKEAILSQLDSIVNSVKN